MGTSASAVCRVECGWSMPSVEFMERYARGLGAPLTITFGLERVPGQAQRLERAERAFGRLIVRAGRLYPMSARNIGLTGPALGDSTTSFQAAVERAAQAADRMDWFAGRWEKSCRDAVAIASIYYDVIDWDAVHARCRPDPERRRLESKVRRRARAILAGPTAQTKARRV